MYEDGHYEIYIEPSGFTGSDTSMLSDQLGSNGLAIDQQERILICQHGNHAIAFCEKKQLRTLVDSYEGRPFNSPNDLAISGDGSVYFTDPPYGLKNQILHPSRFQDAAGLYRFHQGEVALLANDLRYPNGLCFSPGEKYLYVGSNHKDEPVIWQYEISDGKIVHQSELIQQNADGMKCDHKGRLYMATDKGVLVVSPDGKKLVLIGLDETPTNLAWKDAECSTLFVTARSRVYRLRNFKQTS
jgi:gluconolactonase